MAKHQWPTRSKGSTRSKKGLIRLKMQSRWGKRRQWSPKCRKLSLKYFRSENIKNCPGPIGALIRPWLEESRFLIQHGKHYKIPMEWKFLMHNNKLIFFYIFIFKEMSIRKWSIANVEEKADNRKKFWMNFDFVSQKEWKWNLTLELASKDTFVYYA